MPRRAAKFRVRGLAPANDPAWRAAPASVKTAFMNAALAYVLKAKDQELAAGLNRHGAPLVPIRPGTKRYRISAMGPADPNAPPLMPAYATSRTRLWLTATVVGDAVEVSWKNDWGEVLLHHAAGKGRRNRRVAKRDVIGLSDAALTKARGWALGWWVHYSRTGTFLQRNVPTTGGFKPLAVTGRTDFQNFTYGVGKTGTQEQEVARGRLLLAQGRTTGFRQRRPGEGLPALGGPGTLGPPRFGGGGQGPLPFHNLLRIEEVAPKPIPPSMTGPPLERPTFIRARGLGSNYVTVEVSVAKVEAAYEQDPTFYVGAGGVGGIDNRYRDFADFLDRAVADGTKIEQPRIELLSGGRVAFGDGRHRWAVLRDRGYATIPVSVRRAIAGEVRDRFGG